MEKTLIVSYNAIDHVSFSSGGSSNYGGASCGYRYSDTQGANFAGNIDFNPATSFFIISGIKIFRWIADRFWSGNSWWSGGVSLLWSQVSLPNSKYRCEGTFLQALLSVFLHVFIWNKWICMYKIFWYYYFRIHQIRAAHCWSSHPKVQRYHQQASRRRSPGIAEIRFMWYTWNLGFSIPKMVLVEHNKAFWHSSIY